MIICLPPTYRWSRQREKRRLNPNITKQNKQINFHLIILTEYLQVIAAEGEQKASRALKEAADVMVQSPAALQLRYLQTLNTISAEKNSTIIFPLPIDMLQGFIKK